jgi:uncharacterized Tic20 family protein
LIYGATAAIVHRVNVWVRGLRTMNTDMKIFFTVFVLILDFFLLLGPLHYYRNKKEFERRYWGKNRVWLKDQVSMSITKAVLITVFLVAILLSP